MPDTAPSDTLTGEIAAENITLRRLADDPRWLMWLCFALLVATGWGTLFAMAPASAPGSLAYDLLVSLCRVDGSGFGANVFAASIVMWLAMTFAMMLPSAAPMVSVYMDIAAAARDKKMPVVHPGLLVAGYLAVWFGFSLTAAGFQAALHEGGALDGADRLINPFFAGVVLAGAGLYQFTPLKNACLTKCRRPMGYFLANWTQQPMGVFRMGVTQGIACFGCCWALMAVMFAAGLMNLSWMAVLGLIMVLEKTLKNPVLLVKTTGAVLIIAGAATMATGHLL